jgi:uncharacterized protein (TIGR02996 family)
LVHDDPALEKVVHEDPTDEKRWLVYSDALLAKNDPRGQLIAMGARNRHDEVARLIEIYDEELWGDAMDVADGDPFEEITWTGGWEGAVGEPLEATIKFTHSRFGLIDTVSVHGLDPEGHVARAIGRLLSCPMGRFTRLVQLEIGEPFFGEGWPTFDGVLAMMTRAALGGLRGLEMDAAGYQLSWTHSGNLGPLLAKSPFLEEISLRLGEINLGPNLDLPRLRAMTLMTGGLPRKSVEAIGAASWPSLEKLVVYLGRQEYGGDATVDQLAGFLHRPDAFPKLTHLGLCNSEWQDEIVKAVVASPILPQLRSIDLSCGTLEDRELDPIFAAAPKLRHLASLDVSKSYLSASTIRALDEALPGTNVIAEEQRTDEMLRDRERYGSPDWDKRGFRYTAVGE